MANSLSHPQRVALYARVSTLNHGQDVNLQLAELREYASRRGFQVVEEYVDAGVSGSKESRPALNRLMADAHRRSFEAVICWKLDRLGRSLKHLVNALAELEALGVAFISLRDNLDLGTPSGRLMFQIIGAMAEFERCLIQERVKAGLAHARAKGKRFGRRPREVDVALVTARRQEGASWRVLAREFNIPACTLLRAVRRFNHLTRNGGRKCLITAPHATVPRAFQLQLIMQRRGCSSCAVQYPRAATGWPGCPRARRSLPAAPVARGEKARPTRLRSLLLLSTAWSCAASSSITLTDFSNGA